MSFKYKSSVNGAQRNLVPVLIGNSKTVAVGEAVKTYDNAGAATNAAAATPLLGVVHAIVQGEAGLPPVHGTHTAGSVNTSDTNSVTTGASNVTNRTYWALVDTSKSSIYSVTVSGTLGTTAGSPTVTGLRGGKIDVDSANTTYSQVLETTHTRTVATTGNFVVHGVDPEDNTRLLVSIANSELDSDANTEA